MHAGAAAALVHLRVTVRRLEAFRTLAVEAVLLIHARPSISAGAGRAFVYFHVTFGTGEARFTNTVVAVDSVFADAVVTRVAGAVVKVDLAVCSRGSVLTLTDVLVDQVHTLAAILAGVAVALVELILTAVARVAGVAVTGVARNSVDAGAVMTRVGLAVVDIAVAEGAFVTFSAAALEPIGPVVAFRPVLTRRAGALIYVDLTHGASKPWLAGACETVDHVPTDAVIHTWVALAVIHVDLTVRSHVAWHANASELSNAVQASGIVLAGHGQAFVDVDLTAWASISPATLALERAFRVHTLPKVFTWIRADRALVHVLVAGPPHKTGGARADGAPVEGVGVTHGSFVARVADTGVIEVAQQTRLPDWTRAEEGGHSVVAGGAIEADGYRAVVNVFAAVVARPAVHADAGVSADGVEAGAAVVTGVGLHETLVYIFRTVLTCPLRRALAIVGVHAVDAYPAVHALVTRAVIHVVLAVVSLKAWQASAFVGMVARLSAGPSVEALRRGAGQGGHLACAPAVSRRTLAPEGAVGVHAQAPVQAHARLAALVNVTPAIFPLKPGRAGTIVVVIPVDAAGAIGTWGRGTSVDKGAVLASEPSLAHTGELRDAIDHLALTGGPI